MAPTSGRNGSVIILKLYKLYIFRILLVMTFHNTGVHRCFYKCFIYLLQVIFREFYKKFLYLFQNNQ